MQRAAPVLILLNTGLSVACLYGLYALQTAPAYQTRVSTPAGGQVQVYNTYNACN